MERKTPCFKNHGKSYLLSNYGRPNQPNANEASHYRRIMVNLKRLLLGLSNNQEKDIWVESWNWFGISTNRSIVFSLLGTYLKQLLRKGNSLGCLFSFISALGWCVFDPPFPLPSVLGLSPPCRHGAGHPDRAKEMLYLLGPVFLFPQNSLLDLRIAKHLEILMSWSKTCGVLQS